MPSNKPKATRINRWSGLGKNAWSLYKLSEPLPFSESEETWSYLMIEKRLSTYYLAVRTTWFEYDQRFETQAFPSDNEGKPLDFLEKFQELRVFDHDDLMRNNGYEVKISGV